MQFRGFGSTSLLAEWRACIGRWGQKKEDFEDRDDGPILRMESFEDINDGMGVEPLPGRLEA